MCERDAIHGVVTRIAAVDKRRRPLHLAAHDGDLQPPVGQGLVVVRHGLGIDDRAEAARKLERRQLPQPTEQPVWPAAREHERAALLDPHERPGQHLQFVLLLARGGDRQLVLAPGARGLAMHGDRTHETPGRGRRAHRRAELHEALVQLAGCSCHRQCLHELAGVQPQRLHGGGGFDRVLDSIHASEHACDVAIDERRALTKRDRRHRACGIWPDPGDRAQLGRRVW